MNKSLYSLIIILCALSTLIAEEPVKKTDIKTFKPNRSPELKIPYISEEINIDGNLDENLWLNAAVAQNFVETQPGDLTKPKVATEVRIAYNKEYLYVAFICEDDPEKIRASLRDRDG